MNIMDIPNLSFELMENCKVEIVGLIEILKKSNYLPLITIIPRINKDNRLFLNSLDVENDNLIDIITDFLMYSMG